MDNVGAYTGKVKWFNPEKGYGFLTSDDDEEFFVHASGIESGSGDLQPGDRVEFDTQKAQKGPKAVNVRKV